MPSIGKEKKSLGTIGDSSIDFGVVGAYSVQSEAVFGGAA